MKRASNPKKSRGNSAFFFFFLSWMIVTYPVRVIKSLLLSDSTKCTTTKISAVKHLS